MQSFRPFVNKKSLYFYKQELLSLHHHPDIQRSFIYALLYGYISINNSYIREIEKEGGHSINKVNIARIKPDCSVIKIKMSCVLTDINLPMTS